MNTSRKSVKGNSSDDIALTINDKASNDITEPQEEVISTPKVADISGVISFPKDNLVKLDKEEMKLVQMSDTELVRIIKALPGLTPLQIRIIELRYCNLIIILRKRLFYIDVFYHTSRAFISLGSVAIPALLSIQSPTAPHSSIDLYWLTWTISLIVTILHNFTSLFRFDKKFFGLHGTFERLKSEGWQFLELSGHYSGHHGPYPPTHENQFIYFVNAVERISARQVQEEYNAMSEPERLLKNPGLHQTNDDAARRMVPSPAIANMNRTN
jgi:hypothetical protein